MSIDNKLSNILFHNTGSTTAILEAIVGMQVQVEILEEKTYQNKILSSQFSWGDSLILRVTKLKTKSKDLSYNLVVYDLQKLDVFHENFSYLNYPIGRVLENIDYRRIIRNVGWKNPRSFSQIYKFEEVLCEKKYPVKEYHYVHNSRVLFYIFEIYNIEVLSELFKKNT